MARRTHQDDNHGHQADEVGGGARQLLALAPASSPVRSWRHLVRGEGGWQWAPHSSPQVHQHTLSFVRGSWRCRVAIQCTQPCPCRPALRCLPGQLVASRCLQRQSAGNASIRPQQLESHLQARPAPGLSTPAHESGHTAATGAAAWNARTHFKTRFVWGGVRVHMLVPRCSSPHMVLVPPNPTSVSHPCLSTLEHPRQALSEAHPGHSLGCGQVGW